MPGKTCLRENASPAAVGRRDPQCAACGERPGDPGVADIAHPGGEHARGEERVAWICDLSDLLLL
jgi:hypothetical protein